jgi:hypothetical protein
MIKRILLALALIGAMAACNSPAASTPAGASTAPDLSSPSAPDLSSPSEEAPSEAQNESPAAS